MREDLARLVPTAGALFIAADDPFAAVDTIDAYVSGKGSAEAVQLAGVPERLLAEYLDLLPRDPSSRRALLVCGASWALGLRAAPRGEQRWRPVVSGRNLGPPEFELRTGSVLVQLVMSAEHEIRFAPGYFDAAAARYLGPSIAAATERDVAVRLLVVTQLEREHASAELREIIEERGNPARLSVRRAFADGWFAHMKLLSVDERAAYIGSANSTYEGLSTNFELGARVEGPGVAAIERFFDLVQHTVEGGCGEDETH